MDQALATPLCAPYYVASLAVVSMSSARPVLGGPAPSPMVPIMSSINSWVLLPSVQACSAKCGSVTSSRRLDTIASESARGMDMLFLMRTSTTLSNEFVKIAVSRWTGYLQISHHLAP